MPIYIACHKKTPLPQDTCYVPIHVGRKNSLTKIEGMAGDDTGENISTKNSNYCELTALYWIWKNSDLSTFIGINHYRRYFSQVVCGEKFGKGRILSAKRVNALLIENDIVLAKKENLRMTVAQHYERFHFISDFQMTKDVISELCAEYLPSFEAVESSYKISLYNMFIMKGYIYNDYCFWLFSILDALEKKINFKSYDAYQARVFGFISERLLNVWVMHNNNKFKIKEIEVINTDSYCGINDYIKSRIKSLRN
ncbi:DUF4422 domain-containing protein [Hafnia paralvei]|uniref:DUF4422 domain-containing protein n=1 Tax=Hafnia paralvei TaxID=546367 RepID=UPI000BB58EAE|nr:DUF4422 domain-containing protein [Hafnia paralvei]PNK68095.1 DUF4422 domain-containing protein [Hafnia paralvei]